MGATIDLREALLANKAGVEAALERAEAELDSLRARRAELEDLVERARLVLGLGSPDPSHAQARPLTLHRAMEEILGDFPEGLAAPALATEITRRSLYHRRDGLPVDGGQVHARANAYRSIFERRDRRITLREPRR
jgi:hypothetical protein